MEEASAPSVELMQNYTIPGAKANRRRRQCWLTGDGA